VVVKADSQEIVHKTDVGGVAVDLNSEEEVISTVEDMQGRFHVGDLRFLVQRFHPGGQELIVGANVQDGLGHQLMFGTGGVYVEVFKDVSWGITPVTEYEAREMIRTIKSYPLLEGFRGKPGVDRAALQDVIQRLSQLVGDLPDIREMDLNPIIAYEDGLYVVDSRMAI
jgi:acetyltransferase